MCNLQRSPVHKFVLSGIKTNACELAADLVSFKIDQLFCLKTDAVSIPSSKFTTMNFLGHTASWSDFYLGDIFRVCEIKDLIRAMRFQSPLVYNNITFTSSSLEISHFTNKTCPIIPLLLRESATSLPRSSVDKGDTI